MQAKTPVWDLTEIVIGLMRTVLLFGPPGTGKSLAAHTTELSGRELFSLTLTPDTAAAELRGHYVPVGNEFQWRDGPAITAWRRGGRLVINEIHKAGGDALSFLLAALDNPETARLTLPNGETVRPHENFQVIATMNGNPDDELEPALRDRFPAALEINEPHPNGLARLPADLQHVAKNTVCCEQPERRISLRQWLAFADLRRDIGLEDAAQVIFQRRADEVTAALRIAAS
jgi:MoxR-like ATPase